jgi:hypothetical protein
MSTRTHKPAAAFTGLLTAVALCAAPALAVAEPEYKADVPESILTPDRVETRAGTLEFFDGLPSPETVEIVYDTLDRARGMQAFLDGVPAASLYAMCAGLEEIGVSGSAVGIYEGLYNARSLLLTPNTTTVYVLLCYDLEDGPLVVDAPAGVLGAVNDIYFRHVVDIGVTGPDKGKGGKYLFVPPGYDGELPEEGYFVVQSRSYMNWQFTRAFVGEEGLAATVAAVKEKMRIYPWAERDTPPETTFVNLTDKKFNTIHANSIEFFEELKAVVDKEPAGALPVELMGVLASIGIKKGDPFEPDARRRKALEEGVAFGNAAARALVYAPRNRDGHYYEEGAWKTAFVGGDHEFLSEHGRLLDARTLFHYYATGITPAMVAATPGKGSQYALANRDSEGRYLEGSKTYSITLPAPIPANNFWSWIVYDTQTRSLLETDQKFAGVDSNSPDLKPNEDGSYTVFFSPESPEGKEGNWIQTMPGKAWSVVLRLYGPEDPWFDKTWRPGEIELVE